jgi:cystathionine beta-lyase
VQAYSKENGGVLKPLAIEPGPDHGGSPQAQSAGSAGDKARRRTLFLAGCRPATRRIHEPIVDIVGARGHLNPAGLGRARAYSKAGSLGQSSVGFDTLAAYAAADKNGAATYGGAEYGIVQSPEAEAVCAKLTMLHGGAGAIICPSGLSAITTVIDAFAPKAIAIPQNIYSPAHRYMREAGRAEIFFYAADASGEAVAAVLASIAERFGPVDTMLYLEAPGSGTFEIPDIDSLVAQAKRAGVRSVMDNTWASHERFKPIGHGIDIVVQATTKYEGGYADTPSGVAIAAIRQDLDRLRRQLRISGNGAVSPQTCMRLFHRVDTTAARLDRHYATANALVRWFEPQSFVSDVISPARTSNPYHERFKRYFGKGNGLFTVAFDERISTERVEAFVDSLLLFRIAESWGSHVSLVLPVHPSRREAHTLAKGALFRFHAGLEDSTDLLKDLEQASRVLVH